MARTDCVPAVPGRCRTGTASIHVHAHGRQLAPHQHQSRWQRSPVPRSLLLLLRSSLDSLSWSLVPHVDDVMHFLYDDAIRAVFLAAATSLGRLGTCRPLGPSGTTAARQVNATRLLAVLAGCLAAYPPQPVSALSGVEAGGRPAMVTRIFSSGRAGAVKPLSARRVPEVVTG